MARVKVVVRKKSPKKAKPEKKIPVGPKRRLEPRFNSKKTVQNIINDELANDDKSEQMKDNIHEEVASSIDLGNEFNEFSKGEENVNGIDLVMGENIQTEPVTYEALSTFSVYNTDVIEHPSKYAKFTKNYTQTNISNLNNNNNNNNARRRRKVPGSRVWSDREMMDLTAAFQIYGMGEYSKIAEFVKTKDETAVREYIKSSYVLYCKRKRSTLGIKTTHPNSWSKPKMDDVALWPNVRKWRKMAFNQMLPLARHKDLSIPIMTSLCKRFYEEAEEISDPQVIDVKLIYKYMMDCVIGNIPAQLPPKESALVLELLKETKLMSLQYDFEEQRQFLRNFKMATRFKPFQVKDEFKRKCEKRNSATTDESNVVPVPEQVFIDLSRHKKVVQSLNPMMTPVWMLQKEQEYLENYMEESKCK